MIDRRIGVLFVAFVTLLVLALSRAAYLGTIKAGTLRADAATQQVTTVPVPAARGAISDASGTELAVSQTADDVIADPFLVTASLKLRAAQRLAPLLGRPQPKVLAQLSENRGFVYLAHALPAAKAKAIMELTIDGKKIPGISLVPQVTRAYPENSVASQVIGFVNEGDKGFGGLEYRYDKLLGGSAGERRVVFDALGQPISIDDVHSAVPGKPITLTLNSALQSEVEQVLAGVGSTYAPKGATAIVMNPNTGAILALANWPPVDANGVSGPNAATITKAQLPDLQDRAVEFNYEPGSTFKAITVAGALQAGAITPGTKFDIPPYLQVYNQQIHDAESHGYETLSVAQILKYSSNIGADEIAMNKLGAARFNYWMHNFGFGTPTGVDLPGEEPGKVPPYSTWSGTTIATLPFGQGLEVTPIQIASAYAAIANGGLLRTPHIVSTIGGKPVPLAHGRRIISAAVASEMRDMLRGVYADGGTASGAAIPGFDLAGKTGTANVVVNGQYSKSQFIASFIGFVPASSPKLEVMVMVDEPSQGSIYGGAVAAPAFAQIVGWAVPFLGINPCPAPCPSVAESLGQPTGG
ncbi:MAG TPA: penicillin-binding protein 2 [Solirubrobacteraceae bacterium]|nr:penicillin-binding protein 2 [Solirubrobacteraceae bacterium]